MFFKGIIIDLDDTLYNHEICHEYAINIIFEMIFNFVKKINPDINILKIKDEYNDIKNNLKIEIGNTSSSHCRFIYFKHLFENFNIDFKYLDSLHSKYWNEFYSKIKLNEGVLDLLNFLKKINIKTCLLTDFDTIHQFKKLENLGILEYFENIITSQEIGVDKPNSKMFQSALRKMNLKSNEVIMIGDNYQKDILGAIKNNIYSFWFNNENNENNKTLEIFENYIEFSNFETLVTFISNINDELIKFSDISRFCGERFDLTQAGGGNTSFKIENLMFIKSSGVILSDINSYNGYTIVDNDKLKLDIINKNYKKTDEYCRILYKKPSIETYMHSILMKYVVHLHPIQVNKFGVNKYGREKLQSLFPNSLIIDYYSPGEPLCRQILELYSNHKTIFLLNHGVIFTSNNINEIYKNIDNVISKCSQFKTQIQYPNITRYDYVNKLSNMFDKIDTSCKHVSYLCEDMVINEYLNNGINFFKLKPTVPDYVVYCGIKCLFLNKNDDIQQEIEKYIDNLEDIPKVIIIQNYSMKYLYFIANSLKKCREIEGVLKANLLTVNNTKGNILYEYNFLDDNEIKYLTNWDAEKYRRKL